VEFASVVDAVACALAWQKGVADRDTGLRFRIGINLGDVIVQGGDIHGDGVNIAARLEGLAEPGGICLSGDAYRQARGKVEAAFEDLGEQALKNVAEPVRVYRIGGDGSGAADAVPARKPLALPDKPSIAVLPFANMSSDREQDYFSDGITEDIITELSRFRELFVIARNSSFSYKGKAVKAQDIATDLGVRYVLEGSVRAAGDRIRITAQLVDGETGHHIWSERYDRDMPDLFALQDEVAHKVAGTVAGRLRLTAEDRAERKPIESLEALDRARQAYEKAIELDPASTKAYIGLARSYIIDGFNHWGDSDGCSLDKAREYAAKAVSLDNTDSRAQLILGSALVQRGEYEEAKVHLERSLALNPNDADAFAMMGYYLEGIGEPDGAVDCYRTAMRLNPYYPAWYLWKLGDVYFGAGQYEEALIPLKEALSRGPKLKRPRLTLAAAYAQLDRLEEAQREVGLLLADHPDASIEQERQSKFASDVARDHWIGALRKAGLPE
jgi:adenylate cyclase